MADQRYFFLNMINAGVNGGSTKTNHVNWLELDNWDFSMNQTADPNVKGGRPSKTSATGRFGFSIVHNGPKLFQLCSSGQFINSAITFEAERAGLTGTGEHPRARARRWSISGSSSIIRWCRIAVSPAMTAKRWSMSNWYFNRCR